VAGDDIAARVNKFVHGLGVVPGMLPLAGEDDVDRCLGVGLADAHEERIHIEKHGAERHAGDEAELVSARAKTGGNAIHVMALVDERVPPRSHF
jgi:hypothetical protein